MLLHLKFSTKNKNPQIFLGDFPENPQIFLGDFPENPQIF